MSGSRLISAFGLAVIFAQISAILSADIVPVVQLTSEKSESTQFVDALRIISENEFHEEVWKLVGGSLRATVVFTRDNLCVEDLSQEKLKLDNAYFKYFPSVMNPLRVLRDMESYNTSTDDKPETISDGQMIIVPFNSLADIPETWQNLCKENPNLLGFIVGASCSYSRSERTRRAVTTSDSEIIAQADRILLYSSGGIYLKTAGEEEYTSLGKPRSMSSVANASDSVRFDLTFANNASAEITLRLQFTATATKYWYFESVEYEAGTTVLTLTTNNTIYFPFNFSYHCTKDSVFYHNVTTFLSFNDIQVQIDPKVPTANGTAVFSDGYDCIGFTSIPILSGLFVTAIMALIMIWAMTMIMDIRTMDRFDDPKGKTITVAASE